jgi:hypothetical protein
MIRDDESQISARDMSRWLLPACIILLGLALFFLLVRKTESTATPVPVEMPQP